MNGECLHKMLAPRSFALTASFCFILFYPDDYDKHASARYHHTPIGFVEFVGVGSLIWGVRIFAPGYQGR